MRTTSRDPLIAQTDAPVAGTECGNYGERLIVQVVDELARKTPDRIYATFTRSPSELAEGFKDVTFRELANAVNSAAWWIEERFGHSQNFDVIAYIGTSDIRYAIFFLAAIKCGYLIMIPSIRNSTSQNLAVLEDSKCTKVFHSVEFNSKVSDLKQQRPNLQTFVVEELDELLQKPSAHYSYNKSWQEARRDPIAISHSSGSTGKPKPITVNNAVFSVYDNHRKIPRICGRKCQSYALLEFDGGGRFYNPFPPFHFTGLFAMTIMPIFYNSTVTLGPSEKPPTGELLSQTMRMIKIRAAFCPPTVAEQLVTIDGGLDQAASLDWVMYGGGPLAPAIGDRLSQVTDLYQLYGSSETGAQITLAPLKEDWNWFEWHPMLENKMESMGDGTFEMVLERNPSLDWIRHLSQAFPDIDVWRTKDLFIQHPKKPNLWQFVGRRDDVIVLSNGEKFNPVNMEEEILGHPLVVGALILGTGHFQAALLVEPKPDAATTGLIDEIWPTVEKANNIGPAHGRIVRSKVAIARPDKPFLRAGKGTVIRGLTSKLYAEELNALYSEGHEQMAEDNLEIASFEDFSTVKGFVRKCVARLQPQKEISDEDDLFITGFDSLQTMELTKALSRAMGPYTKSSQNTAITAKSIYSHPTIAQLSHFLRQTILPKPSEALSVGNESTQGRGDVMAGLVNKYTADLPTSEQQSIIEQPRQICVALTGSTGSLGSYLLQELLNDAGISRIYCLNRSPDARSRHEKLFHEKGLHYNIDDKCEFLTVAFGERGLGLEPHKFELVRQNVDAIIHNAWKVDFNHVLRSFEDVHIRGVRNMIDWSLFSQRHPHLIFVSSIGSIGNWALRHGVDEPVPERVVDDFALSHAMGYAESKHVSELIINSAVDKSHLRATILRVGQIAGPLAENGGQWNSAEWFPTLVKTSKALGVIPDRMNRIDWIPVDLLARIIQEILHNANKARVYNLVNPTVADWMDLVPSIQEHWKPRDTEIVSFPEWLARLKAQESKTEAHTPTLPAWKLIDFYENLCAEVMMPESGHITFDTSNGRQASKTMSGLSPVDAKAMHTWLQQWQF